MPTFERPYGYRGLPALAFALHGWQRMRIIFRGDSGYFVGDLLELLDTRGHGYLIKVNLIFQNEVTDASADHVRYASVLQAGLSVQHLVL
jgi:hypothetical protein